MEQVKLNSDNNLIPARYVVIDSAVGSNADGTNLWLKCVSYGVENETKLNEYKMDSDEKHLTGAPGAYSVVALSAVSSYRRNYNLNFEPKHNIG